MVPLFEHSLFYYAQTYPGLVGVNAIAFRRVSRRTLQKLFQKTQKASLNVFYKRTAMPNRPDL
jgi:hypothetical protein